jgi:BRCT domain type II-containing protein
MTTESKLRMENGAIISIESDGCEFIRPAIFCFTGRCPKPRSEMEAIAIKVGASVTKSITQKTTVLVISDPNTISTKACKARAKGITMISPSKFFKICDHATTTYGIDEPIHKTHKKPKPPPKPVVKKKKYSNSRRIEL